jgi:hypothetical protein
VCSLDNLIEYSSLGLHRPIYVDDYNQVGSVVCNFCMMPFETHNVLHSRHDVAQEGTLCQEHRHAPL